MEQSSTWEKWGPYAFQWWLRGHKTHPPPSFLWPSVVSHLICIQSNYCCFILRGPKANPCEKKWSLYYAAFLLKNGAHIWSKIYSKKLLFLIVSTISKDLAVEHLRIVLTFILSFQINGKTTVTGKKKEEVNYKLDWKGRFSPYLFFMWLCINVLRERQRVLQSFRGLKGGFKEPHCAHEKNRALLQAIFQDGALVSLSNEWSMCLAQQLFYGKFFQCEIMVMFWCPFPK